MSNGNAPRNETTPTYSFLHTVRRRSRRHKVTRLLSCLWGHPVDISRRVACLGRGLGADVSRRQTFRPVVVLAETSRDKRMVWVVVLDVMKETSAACAAVPREGHVVSYWPIYIRRRSPDLVRACSPRSLRCNHPLYRFRLLHLRKAYTPSPIHAMAPLGVAQIFCGVSPHVRRSNPLRLAEVRLRWVGQAGTEMKHVVA